MSAQSDRIARMRDETRARDYRDDRVRETRGVLQVDWTWSSGTRRYCYSWHPLREEGSLRIVGAGEVRADRGVRSLDGARGRVRVAADFRPILNPRDETVSPHDLVIRPGDLAYLDTFAGLVPCKVLGRGALGSGLGGLQVRVTARRGAYRRGEVLSSPLGTVVPRSAVRVRDGQYRITGARWAFLDES